MSEETVKNEAEQAEDSTATADDTPEAVDEITDTSASTEETTEAEDLEAAVADDENIDVEEVTPHTEANRAVQESTEEAVSEAVEAEESADDAEVTSEATEETVVEGAEVVADETEASAESADAQVQSLSITDLKPGMELTGKVKSIELYGAFIDIGVGKDALLHISQLGQQNVRNVEDVVKKGESIAVYVVKVDAASERIALSLEKPPENPLNQLKAGDIIEGKAIRIENFGVFIDFGAERPGMIHISELATGFVQSPEDVVKMGDTVKAQIIKVNRKKRQIDLSIKALEENEARQAVAEINMPDDEDMPTAMELALRRAMDEAEEEEAGTNENKRQRNKNKQRQQLDDVYSRTLKQHSDS